MNSTHTQFRILRQIRAHKRAAIVGGAGSGKTMLAMEKAQQLAEGWIPRSLRLFQPRVGEIGLAANLKHSNILCSTFHGLGRYARNWANCRPILISLGCL